jgi:hypothetical protein
LFGGGGDQGEFAEKSAHLKPSKNSGRLVNPELDTMNVIPGFYVKTEYSSYA